MVSTPRNLSIHWRATTSRLLLAYGVFFVIWGTALLGYTYWETLHYLETRTDMQLKQQITYLRSLDPDHMLVALNDYIILERTNYNAWGLFDANKKWLYGDVLQFPGGLKIDSDSVRMPTEQVISGPFAPATSTLSVIATRLNNGQILVLAHTTRIAAQVGNIISHAVMWGVSFTLVPGLIGGLILNLGPRRRIRLIESATQPIMRGDLRQRLPVSHRGDELDRLAAIVNDMLDQIERLMGEVKGVCDSIAHDLRTPLTRLRSQLYRVQQELSEEDPHASLIERCASDVDEVLARFRALLRISELEDRRRREGFVDVDLGEILERVHELYAPLAEDQQLQFELHTEPGLIVQADPDLLFEAIGNLVSNAIKFTPVGGQVGLSVRRTGPDLAHIEVADSGPGIPEEQRHAVWQRFYRGDGNRDALGHGLGLSIVAAIAKLHDFELSIGGDGAGTRMGMECPLKPAA
ncbi:sensor histidine kinase [Dyella flava]|uniref:histidine kinase n=1 Tax=Dyella flava TaxID=1920170 RepID=A0ABS2K4E1_9GAMM|nr:HAMP domain-containing sensor histidine kinase [Dyella flava]MBM7126082.1 HAMP domain-containing histidine kinase [Dyella flava]GLQ49113.1 two-component sensor histidine kinase [Dyella flava]